MSAWPKRTRPGAPGHIVQHALGHRLVQHVHELAGPEPAELGQRIEAELAAHDRGRHEQAPGSRADSRARRLPITARTPGGIADLGVRLVHASLGRQQVHDLRHEERVALRLGVDGLDKARRRLDRRRELHVLRHVLGGQAGERDLRGVRLTYELGHRAGQRISQRRIDVTVGADDEQAAVVQLAGEDTEGAGATARQPREGRRARRRAGGPARRCGGTSAPPRRGGSARPPPRAPALRQLGQAFAQLGEQLGELRRAGAELRAQCLGLGVADLDAQRLDPGPVRGRAAGLPAPPDEHAAPRARGRCSTAHRRAGSCRCRAHPASRTRRPRAGEGVVREPATSWASSPLAADEGAARSRRDRRPAARREPPASDWSPGRGSRARARGAAPRARSRAPRRASCERLGRPGARPPAGRSDRARASAEHAGAPCRDAPRSVPRAAPPPRHGGRARASPRSAAPAAAIRRSSRRAISGWAKGS